MQLYNTLKRRKEEFEPLNPPNVGLYTCGPTVYNYAHIGNLRTYIFEDLLRRALEFDGYVVKHVMNITDVGHLTSDADEGEDKMLKGAKREGKTVWEVAEFYTKAFIEDMAHLNLLHPTVVLKATDHIPEMIAQVKQIEAKGFSYIANGNVYFDTSKFKHYGELAQLDKQCLEAGARIEVDKNKKCPHDFVLWFTKSKFSEQEMQWDSPWGRGYPGWHIECSAMSAKALGKQFDIHCGGIDHIPVHHTNEIAQAEAALGVHPWVKYWMHGNFLVLGKNEKMAKSAGNFLRMQTVIDKGYDPLVYRYFCLQSHYRKELTFSWEGLDAAKNALARMKEKVRAPGETVGEPSIGHMDGFHAALDDDLNIPQALAVAWEALESKNVSAANKFATIQEFDRVLGLKLDEECTVCIRPEVEELLILRNKARAKKDWKKSDELRDEIQKFGYDVLDHAGGSDVRPK
jgi:cysteinyl-tRNA synthetase